MNENQILASADKNKEKIFAVIGVISVIAFIIYLIYRSLSFIASLPGFNFDPFTFISIVVLTWYVTRLIQRQNKIIEGQGHILLKASIALENNTLKPLPQTPKKPIKKASRVRSK
jgi:flagellar biogenesis protein FliO